MEKLDQPKPSLGEYFKLYLTRTYVKLKDFNDFIRVAFRYYYNLQFCKIDLALIFIYFFDNPFHISKSYLVEKGAGNPYQYGETYLTAMEEIAKKCDLTESDTVFELGCGRARPCFWLNSFIGCKVVGIDFVPEFIERANRVKNRYGVVGVEFRCEDMFEADYSSATAIYLYGTLLEDDEIKTLIQKFKALPSGTKIITVSYPLTDYTPLFEVMKHFRLQYPWGKANVYLQVKK